MKRNNRAKWGIAVTATVAVLGVAVLPSAQAAPQQSAPQQSRTASVAAKGIPAIVDPAADLAAQPRGTGPTWVDSIYVNGEVKAGGHDYRIVVITQRHADPNQNLLAAAVTDVTTGWFKNYSTVVAAGDYHWSTSGLDITAPGLNWTGNAQHMSIKASTPWGGLDVQFVPEGPALNYAATGVWPMLGDTQNEYAFPSMRTTGTLTLDGKTQQVSGVSWLDRQWGDIPVDDPTMRWTWMSISLPNNDQLALWDVVNSTSENSWATVLHPDGSYELAAVKPLADGVRSTWTSPHTGKTYVTGWQVEIPSLKTKLTVHTVGPDDQESGAGDNGVYEVPAVYTGTYQGQKVTGNTYTEQVGAWKR